MKSVIRTALPGAAVGLLTVAFAIVCVKFTRQTGLASFADDSVSYLIMAQVFSPWQPASQSVAEAFAREAFYAPLFPLLLGGIGASHDVALAHMATAILLAAWLPAVYLLGLRWLGERWAALAALATTALLPSSWIHVKGILSEPLYGLLLLGTLLALEGDGAGRLRRLATALALTALGLTRTAGIALVAAYALWALTRRDRSLCSRAQAMLPALAAVAGYAAWMILRPSAASDTNLQFMLERIQAVAGAENALQALIGGVLTQANAIAEAWVAALLLFWVEGAPVRIALAGAVGVLAVSGLILRAAAGKADGWIMAAYLATYLLWPFHDQMTRFLFPALPVLLLYAYWTAASALRAIGRPALAGHGLLALVLISLSVPALAFIQQRANSGGRYAEMTDWYRRPDLEDARRRVKVHLDLLADMDAIRSLTQPHHRIMWVTPSYIALLADRRGVPAPASNLAPDAYRQAVIDAHPDYVFLSVYHPRDTIHDTAWRTGTQALLGRFAVVYARTSERGDEFSSLLMRIGGLATARDAAR